MTDSIPRTDVPGATLYCGDALDVLRSLPSNSIDLIATDPPYFRVKGLAWDRAWDTRDGFIAWIGQLADEWCRVLKPNGSLYCFASPRMAGRVETEIGKRMEVLNHIIWRKPDGSGAEKGARGGLTRSFIYQTERIIFAEHFGADKAAKGESGYGAECDRLRGLVFGPLRAYLASERDAAGFSTKQVAEEFQKKTGSRTVTGMAGLWFDADQWCLPTEQNYRWLRSLFGGEHLRREYNDLRREYEALRIQYEDFRLQYEDLRRPFAVTADVPYTDVWDFKTVPHRPGKHVCEKPLDLCEHIILASSRPGAVVLDSFAGSGAFGHAAVKHGRTFIGSDNDPHWIAKSAERIAAAAPADMVQQAQPAKQIKLIQPKPAKKSPKPAPSPLQPELFDFLAAE